MKVVITLGGSLLTKELSSENFRKYAEVLLKIKEKVERLIVVCGGGKTAREYMKIAREFNPSLTFLDRIGVVATHLNALALISALGEKAHQKVVRSVEEIENIPKEKIIVCGGNEPGHSTDFDAVLFAEAIRADLLIKATNIDGVYSSDPRKDLNAKKFEKLSYEEFEKIILKNKQEPGKYSLFDLSAIKIIERSKIKLIVINGEDPEEIIRAIEGKHRGTEIGPGSSAG